MMTALQQALGPSTCNWLLIAAAGAVFLGLAALLPILLRRWRGQRRRARG